MNKEQNGQKRVSASSTGEAATTLIRASSLDANSMAMDIHCQKRLGSLRRRRLSFRLRRLAFYVQLGPDVKGVSSPALRHPHSFRYGTNQAGGILGVFHSPRIITQGVEMTSVSLPEASFLFQVLGAGGIPRP
jgi:hypothetical protein